MTRKDYKLIAEAIYTAANTGAALSQENMRTRIVRNLVRALKDDNIRFDADKFTAACGVTL